MVAVVGGVGGISGCVEVISFTGLSRALCLQMAAHCVGVSRDGSVELMSPLMLRWACPNVVECSVENVCQDFGKPCE